MNWEYIAGFFDGEGSITHNGKGFRISISQTNFEVLEEIKNFTKVGRVIKVAKRKPHWKDAWVYFISKQKEVNYFLDKIENLVIVKSKKIKEVKPSVLFVANNIDFKNKFRQRLIKEAKILRKRGLTYRQIGEALNKDFGYVRRIILK